MTVFENLCALLDHHHAKYAVLRHEPVFTSEDAARVRGTPLESGAKALICKLGDDFVMFVMPANLRLSTKEVRRQLREKRLRFATRDEVEELTGLQPGSIPPFGALFGLSTYCDERLGENARIHFNAGDHAISLGLAYAEYARVEQPTFGVFATS